MKLQINETGAWRNCVSFAPEREPEVRVHAQALLRIVGGHISMRIADDQNTAQAYCASPDFVWRER